MTAITAATNSLRLTGGGTTGLALTPRDRRVFALLRRYGAASVLLLAERFFAGSVPAARERLRRLAGGGYLERIPTDTYGGYRLTDRGVRLVAGKRAGRLRRRRGSATVLHAMLVAELAEWHLARRYPNGGAARWYTEQDVRDGVDWLPLPHRRGRFCLPDGVLELATGPAGAEVKRCAIEVERTGKVPAEYPPKLRWYAGKLAAGAFQQVRWFVTEDAEAVVRRAVAAAGLGAAMRVLPLPDGLRVYP